MISSRNKGTNAAQTSKIQTDWSSSQMVPNAQLVQAMQSQASIRANSASSTPSHLPNERLHTTLRCTRWPMHHSKLNNSWRGIRTSTTSKCIPTAHRPSKRSLTRPHTQPNQPPSSSEKTSTPSSRNTRSHTSASNGLLVTCPHTMTYMACNCQTSWQRKQPSFAKRNNFFLTSHHVQTWKRPSKSLA